MCLTYCLWLTFIQFILYSPISQNTNVPQRALQSVHIRHPLTSLPPKNRKKPFTVEKKVRTLQESNRGGSPEQ